MKRFVTIFILVFIAVEGYSFYPKVRNHDRHAYKAGAQNWSITQSREGCMWFANSGIMEYDGSGWTSYGTSNMTAVRSVFYDRDEDRVYFGATNEVGYIHINDSNRKEYVSLIKDIGIEIGDVWGIHKIGDTLWLRENNNIYSYDFKTTQQFCFQDKVAVSAVVEDRLMIFVNNTGVFRMGDDGEFHEVPGTESLNDKRVCAIIPYEEGALLFVTATDGIFVLSNGRLAPFVLEFSSELKKDNVYCAASNGTHIAFGTVTNGVHIKDLKSGSTMHLNTSSGLQNNTVLSMCYDDRGDLWLGLDKGIDMIELSSPEYRLFGNSNRFGAGYASETYDGKLWLGTNQGLYCVDISSGIDDIKDSDIMDTGAIKGQVWTFLKHDNRLFCCSDKGIHIISGDSMRHIPMNGTWKLEVLERHPGYILGSSYDRLFLLKKKGSEWQFDDWVAGFDEASKVFEEDRNGKIWFSHYIKGLFRLEIDTEAKQVTEEEYFSRNEGFPADWSNIPMEVNGDIVFSSVSGFYRYDSYSSCVYPHQQINALFANPPAGTSMYMTPTGDIYFSSSQMQALCYRSGQGHVTDSLSLSNLTTRRIRGFEDIRNLSEDVLMVNTEDGFSIIRTETIKDNRMPLDHELYIKDISVAMEEKDSVLFSSRSDTSCRSASLHLPHRFNSLKFDVNMPTFTSDEQVQYSFMLENYDKGWSKFSETHSKEYTKLPPGKYTFRARAQRPNSADTAETYTTVTIRAPWYLSTSAIAAYIVAFLAAAALIAHSIRKLLAKRSMQMKKRMEEEMKQRHIHSEMAATTMNVIRKNEILSDIDSELEDAMENIVNDRNKSIRILQKIRREIRENIRHDNDWEKFEDNFDIAYNDFIGRLEKKYPDLTMLEKKICVYLKMNLSSKDMAPLLNMTVRSIETSRYRLRKKMQLTRDININEFLQNF